jgi:hypothetical protein
LIVLISRIDPRGQCYTIIGGSVDEPSFCSFVPLGEDMPKPASADLRLDQTNETGLWGVCYEQPFFKLKALALAELHAEERVPPIPVHLPFPFSAWPTALQHFYGLLVSKGDRKNALH